MSKWDDLLGLADTIAARQIAGVAVSMPLGKFGPEPDTFNCWSKLILHTQRAGYRVDVIPAWGVPTVYNRERIAKWFLDWSWDGKEAGPRADWLYWMDSDMTCEPDYLVRMLRDTQERPEILVLSGTARMSGDDNRPVLYRTDGGKFQTIAAWPRNALFTVDAVGTFGMLMHRSVFEQMPRPWFSYQNPGYGSDDAINFCKGLRRAGISIWIDPRLPYGHIDRREISGEPDAYSA